MTSDGQSSVCSQLLEAPGGDLLLFHPGSNFRSATSLGRRSAHFLVPLFTGGEKGMGTSEVRSED